VQELSAAEQRYQAVLSVIEGGLSVTDAAAKVGVSRQTLRGWLARYAGAGLEGCGSVAPAAVVSASDAGRDRGAASRAARAASGGWGLRSRPTAWAGGSCPTPPGSQRTSPTRH
jgi:transposase-like protein